MIVSMEVYQMSYSNILQILLSDVKVSLLTFETETQKTDW